MKQNTLIFLSILALLCFPFSADACTGAYVGRKCSANGNVIIARSNDFAPAVVYPYVRVVDAVKGVPGRMVTGINGFSWELPADTYRCVSVPYPAVADHGVFASAVTNEYGLAISATVTGYYCEAVAKADDKVPGGIAEETIPSVLAPCCKSAREAVDLLAKLIDEKGSAELNIVMMADQKEAWYFEIYSGHQYCAVRMPEDKVAVFGNEFMLDTVDPSSSDVICSKDLFDLPRREGFAVYDESGAMSLRRTYVGDGLLYDFCHLRTWGGHRFLAPSKTPEYRTEDYLPLFFEPDSKVSVSDLMALFRYRYEGTPFCPEEQDRNDVRVIADESQEEVHIIEVYDNLPSEMSCVTWLTLSEAAHAPFVPISNAVSSCIPAYSREAPYFTYDDTCAQLIYKRLNSLCAQDRTLFSPGVKAYWKLIEEHSLSTFSKTLSAAAGLWRKNPESAREWITAECASYQEEALADADRLFEELTWYMMMNTRTMPYKHNYMARTYTPIETAPFEASFDVGEIALRRGWTVNSGDDELSIKLQKGSRTMQITASDGHRTHPGTISENGKSLSVQAILKDGKMYLPLSMIDIFE